MFSFDDVIMNSKNIELSVNKKIDHFLFLWAGEDILATHAGIFVSFVKDKTPVVLKVKVIWVKWKEDLSLPSAVIINNMIW